MSIYLEDYTIPNEVVDKNDGFRVGIRDIIRKQIKPFLQEEGFRDIGWDSFYNGITIVSVLHYIEYGIAPNAPHFGLRIISANENSGLIEKIQGKFPELSLEKSELNPTPFIW